MQLSQLNEQFSCQICYIFTVAVVLLAFLYTCKMKSRRFYWKLDDFWHRFLSVFALFHCNILQFVLQYIDVFQMLILRVQFQIQGAMCVRLWNRKLCHLLNDFWEFIRSNVLFNSPIRSEWFMNRSIFSSCSILLEYIERATSMKEMIKKIMFFLENEINLLILQLNWMTTY